MTSDRVPRQPNRPRLLDLFSGAGGAAMGYARNGFDVWGVDNRDMPRYPFLFRKAAGLDFLAENGHRFDAIHASPPCQRYSAMSSCRPGLADEYPDLIGPVRELLDEIGVPYVIENVPGAPLRSDALLCGQMFGLPLYRHRIFESNVPLVQPPESDHLLPASKAGHWKPGTIMSVSGHVAPIAEARRAMGIDWMTRDELVEAIPPQYTRHIGASLMAAVARSVLDGVA
jgi:DNA (cytosine-5)-methyltransferase 1